MAYLRQDKKAENWGRKRGEMLSTDNCLPETVGVAGLHFGVAGFNLHCGVAGFNPRAFLGSDEDALNVWFMKW